MPETEGGIRAQSLIGRESLASMADWYDLRSLDVSGISGASVEIATQFPGMVCKGFMNVSGGDGNIIVNTAHNSSTNLTIPIDDGKTTPKLPQIKTIIKSGSVSTVLCFLQKINES